MRSDNTALAVIYALLAAFFFAVMGVLVKVAVKDLPNEMIVFFRQFFGLILFTPFFIFQKKNRESLKTSCLPLHLLKAFANIAATYCLVYAVEYLPLVDALVLSYTRPLFLPLVLFFWMGKRFTKSVWLGLIVGFFGVVLILKPSEKVFDIAALIGLCSGLFGAITFSAIRRLTRTESADKIFFYYLLLSLPITILPLAGVWVGVNPTQLGLLFIIGFVGMLYQMTLVRAYRHAKAFKVGSVLYSTIIFAALFDWMLGDKFLDTISIIGILLIFLGCMVTLRGTNIPKSP